MQTTIDLSDRWLVTQAFVFCLEKLMRSAAVKFLGAKRTICILRDFADNLETGLS